MFSGVYTYIMCLDTLKEGLVVKINRVFHVLILCGLALFTLGCGDPKKPVTATVTVPAGDYAVEITAIDRDGMSDIPSSVAYNPASDPAGYGECKVSITKGASGTAIPSGQEFEITIVDDGSGGSAEITNPTSGSGATAKITVTVTGDTIVKIKGTAQTDSPKLAVKVVNVAAATKSITGPVFSVCTHPQAMKIHSINSWGPVANEAGAKVTQFFNPQYFSGSGGPQPTDMDKVEVEEWVSSATNYTGVYLTYAIDDGETSGWLDANVAQDDRHYMPIVPMLTVPFATGTTGSFDVHQYQIFNCKRCNMTRSKAKVVPNSGFTITRSGSKTGSTITLTVTKTPASVTGGGNSASPGTVHLGAPSLSASVIAVP